MAILSSARSAPTRRSTPSCARVLWLAGQPDLSPSVFTSWRQSSSAPLTARSIWRALPPTPATSGVYVAQQYGSSTPSWRIHVAKMLGEVLPDLIAMQVHAPATIAHGDSGTTTVIIMNRGMVPRPHRFVICTLSTDDKITLGGPDITEDPSLTTFPVPALAPNEVKEITVPFTIAARQPAGKLFRRRGS